MNSPWPPAPPPDLRARVLAAVASEPVESRPAARRRRTRALAIGFGVMLALLALVGGPHARGRPIAYVVTLFLAWLPITVAATWAGVVRGRSMLGRPAAWRIAAAVATPLALWATWAAVAVVWPATLADESGPLDLLVCNTATVVFALGPLLAFGSVRRGSDPVYPALTAAGLGAAAGAWGAAVLVLCCMHTSAGHMALGHILPVVLTTLLGLAMSRVVAIRSKTG